MPWLLRHEPRDVTAGASLGLIPRLPQVAARAGFEVGLIDGSVVGINAGSFFFRLEVSFFALLLLLLVRDAPASFYIFGTMNGIFPGDG